MRLSGDRTEKDRPMKMMLLAAAGVLCIGVGAAYADGGDNEGGSVANTYFSELPGVVATAPGAQPNDVAVNGNTAPNTAAVVAPPSTTSNSGG
jgi:hypothetical protein